MKKTERNLFILTIIFVVSLVIANVVTTKLFATGVTLFGIPVVLPGAAVCYSVTFLMTDVIGEIWGKKQAQQTVVYGIIGQIMATALIIFTKHLPAVNPDAQAAYELLLGQNLIFVIGSLAAYFSSQLWDVFIFHKIRNKYVYTKQTNKDRWIWNNISTMSSQFLDTIIFISVAFGIGFGWFWTPGMLPILLTMMVGQYVFKFILSLLDTPIFYLLTPHEAK